MQFTQKLDQIEAALRRTHAPDGRPGRHRRLRPVPQGHQGAAANSRRSSPSTASGSAPTATSRRRAPCWTRHDPELRAMADEEIARLEPELAAHRGGAQGSAAAQGPQRREERRARNPRRHRRRRGHALRRRDLPHVLALRRDAGLEDGSHLVQRIGRGRAEGSHRAGERRARSTAS